MDSSSVNSPTLSLSTVNSVCPQHPAGKDCLSSVQYHILLLDLNMAFSTFTRLNPTLFFTQLLEATSDIMDFSRYLCYLHTKSSVICLPKGRVRGLLDHALYRCHLASLTAFCGSDSVLYPFLGEESAHGLHINLTCPFILNFIQ